ncbi:hypothetical protein DFH94DRAFT_777933 [Russula ochroleuca]|uniref:Secreted protein n=1 Tax=Russula ochroleuca TaxID=152965 RepID=A0A9P5MQ68_9AGAM|nr:hypothetical protein DFH94DRAFT_777933 [Russula ochroleuca]
MSIIALTLGIFTDVFGLGFCGGADRRSCTTKVGNHIDGSVSQRITADLQGSAISAKGPLPGVLYQSGDRRLI